MNKFLESLGLWVTDSQFSFGYDLDLHAQRFMISSRFAGQKLCLCYL